MPPMSRAVLDPRLELSVDERLELIEALWDSVAETPDAVPIPDWQREELDRRLESLRQNPDVGVS